MEKRGVIDPQETPHDPETPVKEAADGQVDLDKLQDGPQTRLTQGVAKCCGGVCRNKKAE